MHRFNQEFLDNLAETKYENTAKNRKGRSQQDVEQERSFFERVGLHDSEGTPNDQKTLPAEKTLDKTKKLEPTPLDVFVKWSSPVPLKTLQRRQREQYPMICDIRYDGPGITNRWTTYTHRKSHDG